MYMYKSKNLPEPDTRPELCCSSRLYSKDPPAAPPGPQPDGSWVYWPDLPRAPPLIYSPDPLRSQDGRVNANVFLQTNSGSVFYRI